MMAFDRILYIFKIEPVIQVFFKIENKNQTGKWYKPNQIQSTGKRISLFYLQFSYCIIYGLLLKKISSILKL